MDFPAEAVDWAARVGLQRSIGELKDWSFQAETFYHSAGQPDESGYGVHERQCPQRVGRGAFRGAYGTGSGTWGSGLATYQPLIDGRRSKLKSVVSTSLSVAVWLAPSNPPNRYPEPAV